MISKESVKKAAEKLKLIETLQEECDKFEARDFKPEIVFRERSENQSNETEGRSNSNDIISNSSTRIFSYTDPNIRSNTNEWTRLDSVSSQPSLVNNFTLNLSEEEMYDIVKFIIDRRKRSISQEEEEYNQIVS